MNLILWKLTCKLIASGSKITVIGEELIPDGTKIFAINHPTSMDPCYVYGLTENAVILMTQFVFDLPIAGRLVSGCGFIPVALRGNGLDTRGRKSAYGLALNTLLKRRNLLIAPEGKMSPENPERKAHNGAARLSYISGCPIIPIGIVHKGKVVKFNLRGQTVRLMPRGETTVNIGTPIYTVSDDFDDNTAHLMDCIDSLAQ